MFLEKVEVYGFRSVQERINNFWINKRLTILVGANEHGKSNLIEAIAYLGEDTIHPDNRCRSRNFNPGEKTAPEIELYLSLTPEEKTMVVERLQNIQAQLPEEEDEETKKLGDRVRQILPSLIANAAPQIKVQVIRNSRRFYYIFPERGAYPKFLDYNHPLNADAKEFFNNMLPKVVSFGPNIDFPNSITLDALNARSSKEWEGLLKLGAGVWESKDKLFENGLDGRDFRQQAKEKIQRKLRTIWSQGKQGEADLKIDIELDASSGQLQLDFIDRTGTRNQPSHRSLGFKSFFSFYLRLYAETTEIDPHGYIFTFDEPGLHLHPSGQKDLLREIRKIAEKNQIIFSTHSPFLIDRHTSTKVLVVSKDQEGTKLDQKPYRKNWAPLRSSLGMVMNDTFFYADKTLLVEGTSDRIFLYALLQKFSDELDIDINFLSIIDGDDRKDLPSIARILLAEDRTLVMLVDKDEGGEALLTQVSALARGMRKSTNLLTRHYGDLTNLPNDISIEDILPSEPLEMAIRKYLSEILKIDEEFSLSDLPQGTHSLGRRLTDYFEVRGWTTASSRFSKTTVADFFAQIFYGYEVPIADNHSSKVVAKRLKELLHLN